MTANSLMQTYSPTRSMTAASPLQQLSPQTRRGSRSTYERVALDNL
jgi:hypothetical protein